MCIIIWTYKNIKIFINFLLYFFLIFTLINLNIIHDVQIFEICNAIVPNEYYSLRTGEFLRTRLHMIIFFSFEIKH